MPDFCAAYGCSNERNIQTRSRWITFHRFPKDRNLKRQWELAVKRKGFVATERSLLCSEHFKPEDFDRTGQTVRLRRGVKPSIFNFPSHLQKKVPSRTTKVMRTAGESVPADLPQQISEDERRSNVKISSRTTEALREAEESLAVKLPPHFQEADPYSNDHNYALPACPTALKARLSEALARVESLERERRNSRIRERRARKNVDALLDAMYSLHAML